MELFSASLVFLLIHCETEGGGRGEEEEKKRRRGETTGFLQPSPHLNAEISKTFLTAAPYLFPS